MSSQLNNNLFSYMYNQEPEPEEENSHIQFLKNKLSARESHIEFLHNHLEDGRKARRNLRIVALLSLLIVVVDLLL